MKCNPPLFLVIEDHPKVGQNNCEFLRIIESQYSSISVTTPEKGIEQLKQKTPELVVVELQCSIFGGKQSTKPGLALLKQIFEHYPTLNILVYTSEPNCLTQAISHIGKHKGDLVVVNKMEKGNINGLPPILILVLSNLL